MEQAIDMSIVKGTINAADRATFLTLWRAFLTEEFKRSRLVYADDTNMRAFLKLYDSYVMGSLNGCCLFAVDDAADETVGCILFGNDTPGGLVLHTTHGNSGNVWGMYVVPSYRKLGIAQELLKAGFNVCLELGFSSVQTHIAVGNVASDALVDTWYDERHTVASMLFMDLVPQEIDDLREQS